MSIEFREKLLEQLRALAAADQDRVLGFARSLAASGALGVPGKDLIGFTGAIEPEDLERMSAAIAAGCEQIDAHEW